MELNIMKTLFSTITALTFAAMLSLPVQAGKLPTYYPDPIIMWFTIDQIDLKQLKIIVNDMPMRLSPNTRVHSPNTEFSSLQALKPGMRVFFSLSGGKTINEIWIVPDNYKHHLKKR